MHYNPNLKQFKVITYLEASDSVDKEDIEKVLQESLHIYQDIISEPEFAYLQSIRITGIEAKND